MKYLSTTGGYAPGVMFLYSLAMLPSTSSYYFVVGIMFNILSNLVLKSIIKQPRPMFDNRQFQYLHRHASLFVYRDGIPFDIYGMPSGHAQTSSFITVFLWLVTRNAAILWFNIALTLLVCYQRVHDRFHTVSQVIVGFLLGALNAYVFYQVAKSKLKGEIKEKKDDNFLGV